MGLDRYMKIDNSEKKKKKKTTTTTTKTTNDKKKKTTPSNNTTPFEKENNHHRQKTDTPSFTFISLTFKCTKCKYKKNMKRPNTFSPREKDLICPKCGGKLKKSRSK